MVAVSGLIFFNFLCGILFTDEFCCVLTHILFVDPNSGEITRKSVFECSSSVAKPCQDLIAIMDQGEMDQGNCFPRDVGLLIGKTGYKQVLMKVIHIIKLLVLPTCKEWH